MTAFRIAARLAEVPEGDVGRGVALAVLAAPASRGAKQPAVLDAEQPASGIVWLTTPLFTPWTNSELLQDVNSGE